MYYTIILSYIILNTSYNNMIILAGYTNLKNPFFVVSEFYCLYLIRIDLSTTVLVVNTKLRTQYTVLEGKRKVNLEKLYYSFPNAYCLLGNN